MVKRRVHKMSTPVLVIGYILLIPSILGILLCLGSLVFGWISAATATASAPMIARTELESATSALPPALMAVGTPFLIFGAICWFVGGIFGWLLVMKKDILQCNRCSAVVAAQ